MCESRCWCPSPAPIASAARRPRDAAGAGSAAIRLQQPCPGTRQLRMKKSISPHLCRSQGTSWRRVAGCYEGEMAANNIAAAARRDQLCLRLRALLYATPRCQGWNERLQTKQERRPICVGRARALGAFEQRQKTATTRAPGRRDVRKLEARAAHRSRVADSNNGAAAASFARTPSPPPFPRATEETKVVTWVRKQGT